MNLNRNPRFEQFDLDDDAGIADFFLEYATELAEATPAGLKTAWRNVAAPFEAALGGGVSEVYKLERPGRHGDDAAIDMNKLALDATPPAPLQLGLAL